MRLLSQKNRAPENLHDLAIRKAPNIIKILNIWPGFRKLSQGFSPQDQPITIGGKP